MPSVYALRTNSMFDAIDKKDSEERVNDGLKSINDNGIQPVIWLEDNIPLFETKDGESVVIVGRLPQATGKEHERGMANKAAEVYGKKVLDSSEGFNIVEIKGISNKSKRFVLKHQVSQKMLRRYPADYTLRNNGERSLFAISLLRLLLEEEFKEYSVRLPEVRIIEDKDSGQRFIATEYIENAKSLKSSIFNRDDSFEMAESKNHELLDVFFGHLLYMQDREFLLKDGALIPFDLETVLSPLFFIKNGEVYHSYNATGYFMRGKQKDYMQIGKRIRSYMLNENGKLKNGLREKIGILIQQSGLANNSTEIKLDEDTLEAVTAEKILAFLEAQANNIVDSLKEKDRAKAIVEYARFQPTLKETAKNIEIVENHISEPQESDYFSLNYSPLTGEEKALIKEALPIITKRKLVTVKSFGIGGDGHELYQTADIILNYIEANDIQGVKIQLIAYEKMENKILSAKRKIESQLAGRLDNIEIKYILIDLNDKEKYEVLVREKADILFCRYTWLAYHNNWDFDRQEEFGDMLADNVNEGGVAYIKYLNSGFPHYHITEIKKVGTGL